VISEHAERLARAVGDLAHRDAVESMCGELAFRRIENGFACASALAQEFRRRF
jgi:hypothetical protein